MDKFETLNSKLDEILAILKVSKVTPKKRSAPVMTEYPPDFEETWREYPKRDGSNDKKAAYGAWKLRRKEQFGSGFIREGVIRYARWCDATEKTGTELVMQAARFFGPRLEFRSPWTITDRVKAITIPRDNDQLVAFAAGRDLRPHTGESYPEFRQRVECAVRGE